VNPAHEQLGAANGSVPSPSRLLEADEVAQQLGMTTDWIYREVRAGRLPHIRLGRYVRFRRESIDAWLDACEHGGRSRRTRDAA
jgi:excisionase family DNA binding protein